MTPETQSPFDAAISELENRIQAMQVTLETLKQLRARPDGSSVSVPFNGRGADSEVRHDSFFGMTIGDAARKYLMMTKATKSTADIAAALELGGLKHSSKDFATTVRSVIGAKEEFTRVPNGDWGLAEWYPAQGRAKRAAEDKHKAKKKKKAKKRPSPATPAATQSPAPPVAPSPDDTGAAQKPGERIEAYLMTHKGANAREIATALGLRLQNVALILSAIARRNEPAPL